MKKLDIPNDEKQQVPDTPKKRIKELMELPLSSKMNFLPPSGFQFNMGPYVYEVCVINGGKLRFTAKLVDVIIKGVNDGESPIIDPKTGDGFETNKTNQR